MTHALTIIVVLVSAAVNWGAMSNQVSSLANEMTRSFIRSDARIEQLEKSVQQIHDEQIRLQAKQEMREQKGK